MAACESELTAALVRRSSYDQCREIYGVASDYSKRFRAELVKASSSVHSMTMARDKLAALFAETGLNGQRR
jgi:hypothetical protein